MRIIEIVNGRTFQQARPLLMDAQKNIHNSSLLVAYINSVNEAWAKIEDEYFKRLEFITKKEHVIGINGYVTTVGRCPYNPSENSFMVCFFYNLVQSVRSIGHEVFHLQLHKYFFEDIQKLIGKDKSHDLKEAITTVILNAEFKDLWFSEDPGYPAHEKLRRFLEEEWKKEKNFEKIIKKGIEFLHN